jgi:hypothetical protein
MNEQQRWRLPALSIGFEKFWRVVGTLCALAYAVLAFRAGLDDRRLWLFVDCMIAGLHLHGAAKSHSQVKAFYKRHGRP